MRTNWTVTCFRICITDFFFPLLTALFTNIFLWKLESMGPSILLPSFTQSLMGKPSLQDQGGGKPWFILFVSFHGVNIPTVADFYWLEALTIDLKNSRIFKVGSHEPVVSNSQTAAGTASSLHRALYPAALHCHAVYGLEKKYIYN